MNPPVLAHFDLSELACFSEKKQNLYKHLRYLIENEEYVTEDGFYHFHFFYHKINTFSESNEKNVSELIDDMSDFFGVESDKIEFDTQRFQVIISVPCE